MLFILATFSCSSQSKKLNLKLIDELSSTNAHSLELPYYAHYKKNDKELIYLVTAHGLDINSSTHLGIKEIIKSFSPQKTIIL
ncbi:MAG: hypothetical protein Q7U04_14955 [Bacteriovorax sp.]|nr:hypothetical protein [Bacteriovorax sp.]